MSRIIQISAVASLLILVGAFVMAPSAHGQTAQSQFTTSVLVGSATATPPTVPTDLSATPVSQSEIDLVWTASTDSSFGVAGYVVYRDGIAVATTTGTAYADTLLTASTTYAYAVQAFDAFPDYSALSATTSTTTLPVPTPPPPATTTPSATPGLGGSSSNGSSLIYGVSISADSGSASISFLTTAPSQSVVSWGVTEDYEAGSEHGVASETSHNVVLTGLSPETAYYVEIIATTADGTQSTYLAQFTTAGLPGTPLPNPSGFAVAAATAHGAPAASLSWTDPTDPRATGVRIVRSDAFFPRDPNDGVPVYEGRGASFLDTGLEAGRTYYYAIFSEGADGLFSSGALAYLRIPLPGQAAAAAPANPFAGLPHAGSVDPEIASLTLPDFEFIQAGEDLTVTGTSTVSINGEENLTVRLPYGRVPQILKTIAVTLTDPSDPSKAFVFLLRANADETYYEASIGALGLPGTYPLAIDVLDYQNQGLKEVGGSLLASAASAPGAPRDPGQLLFWIIPVLVIALLAFLVARKKKAAAAALAVALASSAAIWSAGSVPIARAAYNPEINYQGKLTSAATNMAVGDSSYNVEFKLYTTATGATTSAIWTEDDLVSNGQGVQTKSGLFSVMLGSTTPLAGVNFNQTLYLGVDIGGTGASPVWDGEMSPRKIIGAVPAAFVAGTSTVALSAQTLQNITPGQFFRNDQQNATSSSNTFLNVLQSGSGKIAEFFASTTQSVLAILSNGDVGIGTTTPGFPLAVAGSAFIGGNLTATGTLNVSGLSTLANASTTNLSVSGETTLASSLNGFLQAANGVVTSTTSPSINALSGILGVANGGTNASAQATNGINFYNGASITSSSTLVALPNGDVGIGTSSPWAELTLQQAFGSQTPLFDVATTTSSAFAPSSLFNVQANGDVGIGTTTPSGILSVEGNPSAPSTAQLFNVASSSNSSLFDILGAGDVNIPAVTPTLASSTSSGLIVPHAVYVSGRYAYVLDQVNGLVIFDVSNPASPVAVGSSNSGLNDPYALYVSGRYAYVISLGNSSLTIFDVSNPASPIKVGSTNIGLSSPNSVYVSGRYAYVSSSGNSSLVIFDVSNPASPIKVGSTNIGLSSPNSVYVSGRYAYMPSNGNSSLTIFDVSNPASPVAVGSTTSGLNSPNSVSVSGRYAYVTSYSNNSLTIFDVSNPASPVAVGSTTSGLSTPNSVSVSGRYAYVSSSGNSSLVIFDVSNPASPVAVGSSNSGLNSPSSVSVSGRYAYVPSNGNSSLVIFDLGGLESNAGNFGSLQAGNLQVSNDILAQGQLQINGGLNVGTGGIFSSGPLAVYVASSTQPNAVSAYFQGLVGIGTSTPWAGLSLQNAFGSQLPLFDVATTTSSAFATSSIFRVSANGRIGIGTSSPGNLLSVAGNGFFAGNLTATGTLNVSGLSTLTNASTSNLTVFGNAVLFNASTTNITATGTLNVSGLSTLANASTTNLSVSGETTLASSLNGFLQAANGVVTSTTSPSINALSGILGVANGGTGGNAFSQGWLYSSGGAGALNSSTSPTVNYITATSTTATSTFAGPVSIGTLATSTRFNLTVTGQNLANIPGQPFPTVLDVDSTDSSGDILGSGISFERTVNGDASYLPPSIGFDGSDGLILYGVANDSAAEISLYPSLPYLTNFHVNVLGLDYEDTVGNSIGLNDSTAIRLGPSSPNEIDLNADGSAQFNKGKLVILNTGYLGIGSTTPSNAVTVVGSGYFTGNLTATNVTATGTLAVSATTTTGGLSVGSLSGLLFGASGAVSTVSTSSLGLVTSVSGSGGSTGLTFSGGPITASGTLTLGGTLGAANGGTGSSTLSGILVGNGTNPINSLALPSFLTLSGSALSLGTLGISNGGTNASAQATNGINFYNGASITSSSTLVALPNGDVGIGTSSPWAELTLQQAFGSQTPLFDVATTTSSAFAPSSLFNVQANGDVGIGTSSPGNLLSVAGNGFFAGNLTATGTLNILGNATLTNASTTALTVSATSTTGGLSVGSLSGLLFGASGAVSSVPNGTNGYVLQATGSGEQWVATSSLGISGGGGTNYWTLSGSSLYNNSGTNVGIGTTTPGFPLAVAGSAFIGGNLTATGTLNVSGLSTLANASTTNLSVSGETTLASSLNGFLQAANGVVTSTTSPSINALSGILGVANGGTGQSSFTAGQILFGNGTSNINSSSSLTWDNNFGNLTAPYFTATSTTATTTIAGGLNVGNGALTYSLASTSVSIPSLNLGEFEFPSDSGMVTWADMPVTSASSAGTIESYAANLNGNPVLTIYGIADGAGNVINASVAIGTSSPSSTLTVWATSTESAFNVVSAASSTILTALNSGDVGIGTTTPFAALSLSTPSATSATSTLFAVASTTNQQLLTFLANGKLGLGTTTPSTVLDVNGDITDESVRNCNGASGGIGTDVNGKVYCEVSFSDERLKTDITSLDPSNALDVVDSLNPVSFYWKDPTIPGTNSTQEQFGFIAQQVEQVAPNLVATTTPTYLTPDGTYYLDYQGVIPLLAEAIQAQQGEIGSATSSLSVLTVGQSSLASTTASQSVTLGSLSLSLASTSQSIAALSAAVAALSSTTASLASTTASLASTAASTTASALSASPSFVQTIAAAVENAIQGVGNWVIAKLTATVVIANDIQTQTLEAQTVSAQTAAVTNGIQMTSPDGQAWCVRIDDVGNFNRIAGTCANDATTTPPTETSAPASGVTLTNLLTSGRRWDDGRQARTIASSTPPAPAPTASTSSPYADPSSSATTSPSAAPASASTTPPADASSTSASAASSTAPAIPATAPLTSPDSTPAASPSSAPAADPTPSVSPAAPSTSAGDPGAVAPAPASSPAPVASPDPGTASGSAGASDGGSD